MSAEDPPAGASAGAVRAQIKCAAGRRLLVQARLMVEPCLWCWEIRDPVHGELIKSSWTAEWAAYDSAEEALLAAEQRIAEL